MIYMLCVSFDLVCLYLTRKKVKETEQLTREVTGNINYDNVIFTCEIKN